MFKDQNAERTTNKTNTFISSDPLKQKQYDECCAVIQRIQRNYIPSAILQEVNAKSIAFVYGDYIWIHIGFTPCAEVMDHLEKEFVGLTFGRIRPEKDVQKDMPPKSSGFAYGTPFIGIPLPW